MQVSSSTISPSRHVDPLPVMIVPNPAEDQKASQIWLGDRTQDLTANTLTGSNGPDFELFSSERWNNSLSASAALRSLRG